MKIFTLIINLGANICKVNPHLQHTRLVI